MACPAMLIGYAVDNFHEVIPAIIAPVPRIFVCAREYRVLISFVNSKYLNLHGWRYVETRSGAYDYPATRQ